jgi:hypothetical protein
MPTIQYILNCAYDVICSSRAIKNSLPFTSFEYIDTHSTMAHYTSRSGSGQRIRRVDVRTLIPPVHYAGVQDDEQEDTGAGIEPPTQLRDEDGTLIKQERVENDDDVLQGEDDIFHPDFDVKDEEEEEEEEEEDSEEGGGESSTAIPDKTQSSTAIPHKTQSFPSNKKRRRERISAPHYPDPDSAQRATQIVYPKYGAQVMEEVEGLRKQIAAMDERESKRARTARREEQRSIPAASIAELRTFFQDEWKYQTEMNKNPYMRFALGVAQMTNAKNKHVFVNTPCANLLEELYDKSHSKNSVWILDAATRASGILDRHGLDALPTELNDYTASDARTTLRAVHRDLSKALDTMERRRATLNALKDILRPQVDGSMEDVLAPELIICAEKIVDKVSRMSVSWRDYQITVADVLWNDETLIMLTTAVAHDLNFTRLNTTSMPKSRMDRKMAVFLASKSVNDLARYPANEIVPSARNMHGTMSMMAAQNRVGWGGSGKMRYSVTGVPLPPLF